MLINWICLISIIALVGQVMIFFYVNALSDLKRRKAIAKRVARQTQYNEEYNTYKIYKDRIAK